MRHLVLLFLFAITVASSAQDRKPGLYDLTVTTTMVSPSSAAHAPRTTQVCLTQEMIDKYGAIVPDQLSNLCQFVNVVKKTGGMSADMVCSGGINGKGTLQVNWTDSEHSKGVLHFAGTMHPRDTEIKLEWTAATASTYKGPDCSSLKPAPAAAAPSAATSAPPTN